MAFDRRLLSGAVVAVTVVIAGANALPALLPGPADMPAAATAIATVDALPQPVAPDRPALQAELAAPPPAIAALSAPPAALSPAPSAEAAFPSVQPPTIEPAVAPPAAATTRPARAQHAPEKAAQDPRPVEQKERRVARARPVRPAIYPLREFFAWTR